MSPGSVTAWIGQICAGDHDVAQQLLQRYFQRLVALARQKLRGAPRGMADEEDVALSAFKSFCRGAEQGRFPQLSDRYDLWRLLFVKSTAPFDKISSQEPTPEQAVLVAEQFRLLLDALKDETLQAVAVAKMEGYKNKEIAKQIKRTVPTVERKLNLIRTKWKKEMAR